MSTPELTQLKPRNEGEEHAAARAVHERRRLDEQTKLVDDLTDKERLLVEEAWEAGAAAARKELRQALVHPHAVTLDAASVAREVKGWAQAPQVHRPENWWPDSAPYDNRIVGLVRRANHRLEAEQQGATP